MKFKELLLPLSLALLTTYALQYFWGPASQPAQNQAAQSGQRFTAQKTTEIELRKPLNLEVDFIDTKTARKAVTTQIDTPHARYVFSTDGASLEQVEFLRNWGGKQSYLSTVFPPSVLDRERRCFLVALAEQTPYFYDLVGHEQMDDRHVLTYIASTDQTTIRKQFTIYKEKYQLDLNLTVEPKAGASIEPRIFYPSPFVPELGSEDAVTCLVNEGVKGVAVVPRNQEIETSYWVRPTLFGAQDRYFIHAFVGDKNHFVERGYFKTLSIESLASILEGPTVTAPTSWDLSFYFGPKIDDDMAKVDARLEQTLNYGWLGFISKPLSKWLLEILNFLNRFFNNYGFSIIALTILMKLLLVPFTWRAEQGMKGRVDYQKKLEHIQHKYKNDPQALTAARAELVRKYGMPGMGGCLVLLLQIPIFITLSWVLSHAIELYRAPFIGWITDLSSKDPYYVLPLLTGIAMIFHSPVAQSTSQPNLQQRLGGVLMAVLITAFTANLPAGLTLYIFVSTLLGVIQSKIQGYLAR